MATSKSVMAERIASCCGLFHRKRLHLGSLPDRRALAQAVFTSSKGPHNTAMAWATRPIIPAITVRQADQQADSETSQRKAAGCAVSVVDLLPSSRARNFRPTSQLPPDEIREFPRGPPYLVYSHFPPYQQSRVFRKHFSKPSSEIGSHWHLHQAFRKPQVWRAAGL
jgi:hypothetical protein